MEGVYRGVFERLVGHLSDSALALFSSPQIKSHSLTHMRERKRSAHCTWENGNKGLSVCKALQWKPKRVRQSCNARKENALIFRRNKETSDLLTTFSRESRFRQSQTSSEDRSCQRFCGKLALKIWRCWKAESHA